MYTNRRVFDWPSQEQFAQISCDYNPIHMDATLARRTHVGAPIVHGIHSLVWILDCYARSGLEALRPKTLKAQFLQPIYVGDEVALEISKPTPQTVRARITVADTELVVVSLGLECVQRAAFSAEKREYAPSASPAAPQELRIEEMSEQSGCLSFGPMISHLDTIFPSAVRTFGTQTIAALVSSSCVVGMLVPGLHSLFLGLDVSLSEDGAAPDQALQFSVLSVAARFRAVRIGISARGLQGTLETVSRMPPVRQPSMNKLRTLISRDEFSKSTALIVGGSRGLGELTAKLIAAGGGRVVITYVTGKADAQVIVEEIEAAGSTCTAVAYDVLKPAIEQLAALDVVPTHLYYFATPRISRRKFGLFDVERYAEFNSYYLNSYYDLVLACSRLRPEGIRVFYPSTTFVEARPAALTEYAMSKAAAEVLCSDLGKYIPNVKVLTRRLPRLPTDQTSSPGQADSADPIEVILPIVREMHRQ